MSEKVSAEAEELRELIQQARAHLRRQQRLGVERLHVAWPERRGVAPAPSLTLTQVREELGECTRCKLHTGRKHIVFGVGDPNAWLVFVGEAPGADEDEQGEPFVGRAGQLLTRIIEAMKLMNEIDSEYDGEIVNIYVESGQPVQYGERLFAIRTV